MQTISKLHPSDLSIIVVTYNRCNDLKESLDALLSLDDPPGEIIVVDSNSSDATCKTITKYPVKFITLNERSMVKARNKGWKIAKGDIVAFVDDDALVSKDWTKHILEPYSNKNVGGVVGRVISSRNSEITCVPSKNNAIGKVFNNGLVLGNFDLQTKNPIEVDTQIGCNMSFRKNLLLKVAGFDENFRGNCFRDDTDISLRIKNLNYKLIFNPKALVLHKYKGKNVASRWFYWTVYNHTYFYLKNFRPMTPRKVINFLIATFLPPADYMKKTKIKIKPTFSSFVYVVLGLINALYVSRKGDPLRIEKILRID